MLTRRHIRVKVMQSLYALFRDEDTEFSLEKKFLDKSMADMYDQFLLDISLLIEVKNQAKDYLEKSQNKHLATAEDKNPNLKFVENAIIAKFENCEALEGLLEKRKLN